MIAAGTYAAVVVPVQTANGPTYCQFGESGKKKTPMVTARFEILRGPYAGQSLTWYGYFTDTEGVAERTIKALRACGFRSDLFADMVTEVVNQEFQIVVEIETDDKGRQRPKVLWVNPVASGLRIENQMTPSALRLFSSRFQGKLKAITPISGPPPTRDEPGTAAADDVGDAPTGDTGYGDEPSRDTRGGPPPGDDEIPF